MNSVDAENVVNDLEVDFLRLEVLHVEFHSLDAVFFIDAHCLSVH